MLCWNSVYTLVRSRRMWLPSTPPFGAIQIAINCSNGQRDERCNLYVRAVDGWTGDEVSVCLRGWGGGEAAECRETYGVMVWSPRRRGCKVKGCMLLNQSSCERSLIVFVRLVILKIEEKRNISHLNRRMSCSNLVLGSLPTAVMLLVVSMNAQPAATQHSV